MTNPDPSTFKIASGGIAAEVSMLGAELVRLQDESGGDVLWNGDPTFWAGRAPILFPIVGRLHGDALKVEGVVYPMRQHGFARTSLFELVAHDSASCHLRLQSSSQTRTSYPFEFSLDLTYRVSDAALEIAAEVRNTGMGPLPIAFGFHPAFRWPLPYGEARAAHEIVFEHTEPAPISALRQGLLTSAPAPITIDHRTLPLSDDLFQNDALIFLQLRSRSVRYGAGGRRSIRVDFVGMPQLGLWSKPGAGFVCIEPWHGYASPETFDGELSEKPGMISLAPGDTHDFSMLVTLEGGSPAA